MTDTDTHFGKKICQLTERKYLAIKGMGERTLKNQSSDWSTQFMKVILLELSLVRTILQVLQYMCTVTKLQY